MRRLFKTLVSLALVVALVVAVGGFFTVRASFPTTDGEIAAIALGGPVDIYRDANGVPQIFADDPYDLFFAQGYVQAQDRFWQMDFQRHVGHATLSEMFGASQIKTDIFLRALGWSRVAEQEWAAMRPERAEALAAFSDGVNAYLGDNSGAGISLEYAVLKLTNPSYSPAPWNRSTASSGPK
jgi:penicillin amidase